MRSLKHGLAVTVPALLLASVAFAGTTDQGRSYADTNANTAPFRQVSTQDIANSGRGGAWDSDSRLRGGATTREHLDDVLYQYRQILGKVNQALKNPDLTSDERQALLAKKSEVESDIVAVQQE